MIPRTILEIQQTDNVDNDFHANVKVDTSIMVETSLENQQNLNEKIEVNEIIDDGLSLPNTDKMQITSNLNIIQNNVYSTNPSRTTDNFGPITLKPKTIWT